MTEDRYIITIANEYHDIKEDKWMTIDEVFDLLNEQDQQIQQIKTILTDMTEETFNDRIKNDDREDLLEYYKGKHDAIGDVNKRILEVLLK